MIKRAQINLLVEKHAKRMPIECAIKVVTAYMINDKYGENTDQWFNTYMVGSKLWCFHVEYRNLTHKAMLDKFIVKFVSSMNQLTSFSYYSKYYKHLDNFKEFNSLTKPKIP